MKADATEQSHTQPDNVLSAVVVEAVSCMDTDMGDESVQSMHGLLTGLTQTSERLAAMPLDKLKPSPFYNMIADGKPVDKALTMLHLTQRSNGKQHACGFRILTEPVQDATAGATTQLTNANCYATVALCTFEKVSDFSPATDATVIAVISKVVAPAKPQQHAADLYVEAMEVITQQDVPRALQTMHQLQQISNTEFGDPASPSQVAWQQRKCRRLLRYPTLEASC